MTLLFAALLLLGAPTAPPPAAAPPPQSSPARAGMPDGRDAANAIKVDSVDEEYAILRRLRLKPQMQSLMIVDGRPYDRIRVVDRRGKKREIWFDIGSFFGKGF